MDANAPHTFQTPERAEDRQFAADGKPESAGHTEFVRTQSELMQTMLKMMIFASGWKDDGQPDGTP